MGRRTTVSPDGGVINIAKPQHVNLNAIARSGSRQVVLAGSAGDAMYIARYSVPTH